MARIIVTTDRCERLDVPVLLDERICLAHLSNDHGAAQLIERLTWAITDAEDAERVHAERAQSDRPSSHVDSPDLARLHPIETGGR